MGVWGKIYSSIFFVFEERRMKVYTLNSFARNNETGRFTEYYDNHGVFIMRRYAEQFSTEHDLEHREWFGETLRYVIEEFEI